MSQDQAEQNIQMWKVKKLIKSLDAARGLVPVIMAWIIARIVDMLRELFAYCDLTESRAAWLHCIFLLRLFAHHYLQSWHIYDQSHHPTQGELSDSPRNVLPRLPRMV